MRVPMAAFSGSTLRGCVDAGLQGLRRPRRVPRGGMRTPHTPAQTRAGWGGVGGLWAAWSLNSVPREGPSGLPPSLPAMPLSLLGVTRDPGAY